MYTGSDILISDMNGDAFIAMSRAQNMKVDGEVIEVSSATNQDYRHYIPGRKGWELTINFFVSNIGEEAMQVGQSYDLYILDRADNDTLTPLGNVICKTYDVSDSKGALVKGTFSFVGNGPIFPD